MNAKLQTNQKPRPQHKKSVPTNLNAFYPKLTSEHKKYIKQILPNPAQETLKSLYFLIEDQWRIDAYFNSERERKRNTKNTADALSSLKSHLKKSVKLINSIPRLGLDLDQWFLFANKELNLPSYRNDNVLLNIAEKERYKTLAMLEIKSPDEIHKVHELSGSQTILKGLIAGIEKLESKLKIEKPGRKSALQYAVFIQRLATFFEKELPDIPSKAVTSRFYILVQYLFADVMELGINEPARHIQNALKRRSLASQGTK